MIVHELGVFPTNVHIAIPYKDEAQADAATNDPHLKLMFRLLKFEVQEEQDSEQKRLRIMGTDRYSNSDLDEIQWMVPAKLMPFDVQSHLNVINQFLESPIDLQGKNASELLKKKPRKRKPRRVEVDEDGEPLAKKERKKNEAQQYKSATMIEDSDADEDEWASFFEREKKLAEKTALAAAASGTSGTMRATGTKKRKTDRKKRRRKRGGDATSGSEAEKSGSGTDEDPFVAQTPQQDGAPPPKEPAPPKPARPRPRPRKRLRASSPPQSSSPPLEPAPLPDLEGNDNGNSGPSPSAKPVKRHRLVISEEEDE